MLGIYSLPCPQVLLQRPCDESRAGAGAQGCQPLGQVVVQFPGNRAPFFLADGRLVNFESDDRARSSRDAKEFEENLSWSQKLADKVKAGDVLCDGSSTSGGEIALRGYHLASKLKVDGKPSRPARPISW